MERRVTGSLWGHNGKRQILQYRVGDLVSPIGIASNTIHGTVMRVENAINKVYVAWNGGLVKQHDPDDIQLCVETIGGWSVPRYAKEDKIEITSTTRRSSLR